MTQRILRSTILGLAAAAFLGGASLATLAPASAQQLGTVTIAQHIDLDTLDGSQNVTTHHRYVFRHIYDPLLTLDADGQVQPALAESWENIDPVTWRFRLRHDVKFQNGEPFTAEAVKLAIELSRDPAAQSRSSMSIFSDVKIIDDYTLDIVTRQPAANALYQIADFVFPVPPRYYHEVGAAAFAQKPIGTGAYKVVSWQRGDKITLEANPDWWGGTPKATQVVFWAIPEASTRVAAVLNGEADIASQVPPIQVPRFEGSDTAHIDASDAGVQPIWGGMLNDRKPFDDIRVRRAVNHAVNKQAIVDRLLRGYGRVMNQPCSAATVCFVDGLSDFEYDPEKAKALLAEAGVGKVSVTLDAPIGIVPQAAEITEIVAGNLRAVGFEVKTRVEEWPVFSKRLFDVANRQAELGDMFLMYYKAGPTAEGTIRNITESTNDWNWTHFVNAEIDEHWKDALADFNPETRKVTLQEISRIHHDQAPWFYLYEPLSVWAISNRLEWKPRNDDFVYVEDMNLR